jgi:hypothetical protein
MNATQADAAREAAMQLEALAEDLEGRGFIATVTQAGGDARVSVVNRLASQLSENVYAARAGDGSWWFWWSWADRIAPITEVETAAFKIAYVLAPHVDEQVMP